MAALESEHRASGSHPQPGRQDPEALAPGSGGPRDRSGEPRGLPVSGQATVTLCLTGQAASTSLPESSIAVRLLAGCTTGAMAVTCAQPTDVVKVRFQACVQLEPGSRKYSGTVDAYRTIAREEGVRGLWKGTVPNITRNAIVNCAEMVTYDLIKESLTDHHLMTDDFPCHFVSAFGAGFCATVVASPVDVVKTRYMNSAPGQYPGVFGCMKAVAGEGPAAFYKGFTPSFLRLGSWNVVMFVTYEQLKRALMEVRVSWESPF
uniref:Uncoupling protein 3 n=1 Tax=Ornithorhynchus anatinus TaxID=9258 RepID=A0A6I8P477_ORNAN